MLRPRLRQRCCLRVFLLPLQTRPVCFSVRAIVTPGDIAFNVKEINFGYCTTVESVRQTITITNKSILPQIYGFCGVPEVATFLEEFMRICNFLEEFLRISYF